MIKHSKNHKVCSHCLKEHHTQVFCNDCGKYVKPKPNQAYYDPRLPDLNIKGEMLE
jgi:Fe2+ or Zn2+ uptake regulation protein